MHCQFIVSKIIKSWCKVNVWYQKTKKFLTMLSAMNNNYYCISCWCFHFFGKIFCILYLFFCDCALPHSIISCRDQDAKGPKSSTFQRLTNIFKFQVMRGVIAYMYIILIVSYHRWLDSLSLNKAQINL